MSNRGLLFVPVLLVAGAYFSWLAWDERSEASVVDVLAGSGREQVTVVLAEPAAPQGGGVDSKDKVAVSADGRSAFECGAARRIDKGGGTVVVRLLRADTRAALPGLRVRLVRDGVEGPTAFSTGRCAGSLGDALRADDLGGCTFRLPAGVRALAYPVDAKLAAGVESLRVEPLAPGETREISMMLAVVDHWIRVEDAADGEPLANVRVRSTNGRDTSTGLQGLAMFRHILGEAEKLDIEAEGYGPARMMVTQAHETPESAQVVRLSRSASLHGRILDQVGDVVRNSALEIVVQGTNHAWDGPLVNQERSTRILELPHRTWRGRTDASGAFSICGLPSAVPLRIRVSVGGRWEEIPERPRLLAGEERVIVLRLRGLGGLRGLVRDESGEPVPDCTLWLASGAFAFFARQATPPERSLLSDAEGRFAVPDLPPGVWSLGPAPGGPHLSLTTVVRVLEGGSSTEVVVEARTGHLFVAGRVLGPDGTPVQKAHVFSDSGLSAECGSDGSFRIGPLVPGPVTLGLSSLTTGAPSLGGFKVQAGEEGIVLRLVRSEPADA